MESLISAFTSAWQKSFDYSGRSSRSDYWWFFLANVLVTAILNLLALAGSFFYNLAVLYMIAQIVPHLPLTVRRLRDAGKPWAWIFIGLIPIIGAVWMIYLLVQPSVGALA
jgi:uncharacterized membrane protein YhaH (DUF805 family)